LKYLDPYKKFDKPKVMASGFWVVAKDTGKKVCKIDYLLDNAQKLMVLLYSKENLSESGKEMANKLEKFLRKW